MGKHSAWRKIAKKLRRKRIRQEIAKKLAAKEDKERKKRESSPTYIAWKAEQEALELFQEQEEERLAEERREEWRKREEEALIQWKEQQEKLAKIREERAKQVEIIRQEWQREQEKIKEIKERNKRLKEENERRLEELQRRTEEYMLNGGELPEELTVARETNPNKPICPFFKKTGACRFKDVCSRNHIRPGISKILLFPSFYSHFSLEQTADSEHGSDMSLEYDDQETYNHFREFFNDILPEFEKFGQLRQLKVCCNKEPHLRGNVYIEYDKTREALRAYKTFQGRWYGGKQLNVEFCNISSWKSAICGMSFKNRCPKGSTCNFLHVFNNPGRMFQNADRDLHRRSTHNNENFESVDSRRWRWSESPENENSGKENSETPKYDRESTRNGESSRSRKSNIEWSSRRERRSRSLSSDNDRRYTDNRNNRSSRKRRKETSSSRSRRSRSSSNERERSVTLKNDDGKNPRNGESRRKKKRSSSRSRRSSSHSRHRKERKRSK